jgi:uncharacterized protein (DUF983 family)
VSPRIPLPSAERLRAVLQQRCPNCLQGKVFNGVFQMNERCPVCSHVFIREQGYFQGAMYVSYGLALVTIFALTGITLLILPSHSEVLSLLIIIPIFLLLVPMIYRYSRVIWMHLFYRAF